MLNVPEEVKALCRTDGVLKNFRVHFIELDLPDLTNKDIVTESVTFTESLCSRDKLKFGVCEASSISFDAVNIPNIKGELIQCGIDIDCSSIVDETFRMISDVGTTNKMNDFSKCYDFVANENDKIEIDFSLDDLSPSESYFDICFSDDTFERIKFTWKEKHIEYTVPSGKEVRKVQAFLSIFMYESLMNDFISNYSISIKKNAPDIEGITWNADLDYPTYYIPYGEFAVDSCKKEADTEKRSVMAYSYENITDYNLPNSLNSLYWYTNKNAYNIKFSVDDLLELTFPSYSVARNPMVLEVSSEVLPSMEIEDWKIDLNYAIAKVADIRQLISAHNEFIFTYIAKFNQKKHDEMIRDAREFILNNCGIDASEYLSNFVCDAKMICNAYSVITSKTNGELVSLTGPNWYTATLDYLNASNNDVVIDGMPHTIFKIVDYSKSGTTVTSSGYLLDPVYQNEPEFDNGGYIYIPYSISLYKKNEFGEYAISNGWQSNNYVKHSRHGVGQGDVVFTLAPNQQLRNVYTYTYSNHKTVGAGYRTDYSYNEAVSKLNDSTWRNLIESCVELRGCLGHFDRNGKFELKKIKISDGLYPSDTLYPLDNLYPKDVKDLLLHNTLYSSAWFSDEPTRPIGAVSANFKGTGGFSHFIEVPAPIKNEEAFFDEDVYIEYNPDSKKYETTILIGGYISRNGDVLLIESNESFISSVEIAYYDEVVSQSKKYTLELEPLSRKAMITADDEGGSIVGNMQNISIIKLCFAVETITTENVKIYNMSLSNLEDENYSSYDMTSNYFISSSGKTREYVKSILNKIAPEIAGTQYTPSNIECIGQPYIEAGDWVTVVTERNGFDSLILSRTLKGIQTLKDSYESRGE